MCWDIWSISNSPRMCFSIRLFVARTTRVISWTPEVFKTDGCNVAWQNQEKLVVGIFPYVCLVVLLKLKSSYICVYVCILLINDYVYSLMPMKSDLWGLQLTINFSGKLYCPHPFNTVPTYIVWDTSKWNFSDLSNKHCMLHTTLPPKMK
jgi:hypothetical protein